MDYSDNSFRYFKVEPIKWRILTEDYNNTGKTLLFAEKTLYAGCTPLNVQEEFSSHFFQYAFSDISKRIIADTTLPDISEDEIYKVFLLSKAEIETSGYGFRGGNGADNNRHRVPTDFAKAKSADPVNNVYWLRTPNNSRYYVVLDEGNSNNYYTTSRNPKRCGIVPALCIDWP